MEKPMMTQAELTEKFNYVRRRHNRRQLLVIIIASSILFGALLSIDNLSLTVTGRHICVYIVAGLFLLIGITGSISNYQKDKRDCYTIKFTCPHCGKHLYD